jgi:DNA-binding NarL/FixJ family response regulator
MGSMEILIADDHELFRRGLRSFLESQPDWHVCGEAADGKEAVAKAKELKPDVVLLDVSMPGMNGLEAARVIRRETPESEILIVSQNDASLMEKAALQAGATRYIQKTRISPDLTEALEALSKSNDPLAGNKPEQGTSNGAEHDPAVEKRDQQVGAVIDALPAAIYTTDAEGRLTHFNPAAVKFSGRLPELGSDRWCVRILIADDNELVRRGVARIVSSHADWQVCGEASDGLVTLNKARELRPDLVLLDINMPGLDGLETSRRLRQEFAEIKIIIMSHNDADKFLPEARKAGADGCVDKARIVTDLPIIIDTVGDWSLSTRLG